MQVVLMIFTIPVVTGAKPQNNQEQGRMGGRGTLPVWIHEQRRQPMCMGRWRAELTHTGLPRDTAHTGWRRGSTGGPGPLVRSSGVLS